VADEIESILEGAIIADSADVTAMNAAYSHGYTEGMKFFMQFRGDEPEEA